MAPLWAARIAKLHRKVSKIEAWPPPFASWASGFGLEITWYWVKNETKFEGRPFFFLLFTWFWAKNGTKFEWRLFFSALRLILGEKWDEIWVWQFQILIYVPLKFSEVSAPPPHPPPPPFQYPAYATGPRALLYLAHGYPQYQIGLPHYNRSNCSEPNSKLNPQLPHCRVRKDRNARKSLPLHDWNLKHLTKLPPQRSSRSGGWISFMFTTTTGSLPACQ